MNQDYQSLLEQAQAARTQADWLSLVQCLQQLTTGEKVSSWALLELEQVLDLAIEVLQLGDFQERWDIAKVLSKLGESAVAPLIEILEDEEAEELRWFASRILGDLAAPEAIAALIEVLKTAQSEELSGMAAAALGNIGTPAVDALAKLLAHEDTRLLAVRTLSYIRSQATIAPLLDVVQDSQVAIRAAAIEALSSFHDPRIPPILLNALDDVAATVRREAVIGLSFRSDLREELALVARLSPRLHDFNLEVCCACAIGLGRLGTDTASDVLYQVLVSAHTPVNLQIEIIRALGWIGTATSLEYLTSYLNQQSSVTLAEEIVAVLGRVKSTSTSSIAQTLIELLNSDHPITQSARVKSTIALSLSQLGDLQAVEPLIQLLAAEPAVRLHAIAALKKLAPEIARQRLEQLATGELAPELKQGVTIALAEWSLTEAGGYSTQESF